MCIQKVNKVLYINITQQILFYSILYPFYKLGDAKAKLTDFESVFFQQDLLDLTVEFYVLDHEQNCSYAKIICKLS